MDSRALVDYALKPFRERDFTYGRYVGFLDRLRSDERHHIVPLRDFHGAPRDGRVLFGLRHDVDVDAASALEMAKLERARRLRATYFVLHTAPYYALVSRGVVCRRRQVLDFMRRLQDLGHEVGLHNDLVTLQGIYGVDALAYAKEELAWLRGEGVDIVGVAAHGSEYCLRYGYHNQYFFAELADEERAGFPNRELVRTEAGAFRIQRGSLRALGFAYDASHLGNDHHFSDLPGADGRRWHPDELPWHRFQPGERVIVLTHPVHWGGSLPKYGRMATRFVRNRLQRLRGSRGRGKL